MASIQMNFIERKLTELYLPHVDVGDRPFQNADEERKAKLSAALAALALQSRMGGDVEKACAAVVDGPHDMGIDAIGINDQNDPTDIYFVQAKWSDDGKANFGAKEARDFLEGVQTIVDRRFNRLNEKIRAMRPQLEAAMNGLARVHLVIAVARTQELHHNVESHLDETLADWNQIHPIYDWDLFTVNECVPLLRDDEPQSIDVTASFEDYLQIDDPFLAYAGTLDVAQLAGWYRKYRDRLLDRNIRHTLPSSEVNAGIQRSLEDRPEWFWYLSNGITVVCDRIEAGVNSTRRGRSSQSNNFRLINASIVNGAQTIGAIRSAIASAESAADADGSSSDTESEEDLESPVKSARVLVKVISLENAPSTLGTDVTIATNTQNKVEERDFKSNDDVQVRLREEFRLSDPSRTYVIKRGENVSGEGLGIEEAADALAATFRDPRIAADARRSPSSLWGLHYDRLFRRNDVAAGFVWRSVTLLRMVQERLAPKRAGRAGRGKDLATYGDLLITYVVHRRMGDRILSSSEDVWTARLREVPSLVDAATGVMENVINRKYGRGSHVQTAVHNADKAFAVATETLATLDGQDPDEATRVAQEQQRRTRRARSTNAVQLIVQEGRLAEGSTLKFTSVTRADRVEMREWLDADPARGRATWTNDASAPLTWEYDGKHYSPSGLAKRMRTMAYDNEQQVQGTRYWLAPGQGTLHQIADQIRTEQDYVDEE